MGRRLVKPNGRRYCAKCGVWVATLRAGKYIPRPNEGRGGTEYRCNKHPQER
jgi:hypothetical protein